VEAAAKTKKNQCFLCSLLSAKQQLTEKKIILLSHNFATFHQLNFFLKLGKFFGHFPVIDQYFFEMTEKN